MCTLVAWGNCKLYWWSNSSLWTESGHKMGEVTAVRRESLQVYWTCESPVCERRRPHRWSNVRDWLFEMCSKHLWCQSLRNEDNKKNLCFRRWKPPIVFGEVTGVAGTFGVSKKLTKKCGTSYETFLTGQYSFHFYDSQMALVVKAADFFRWSNVICWRESLQWSNASW